MWMVDIFPFLKHLPSWFPGAGFKRKAAKWRAEIEDAADAPFQWAKANTTASTPCYCTLLLGTEAGAPNRMGTKGEFDIMWTALTMYTGSIDTTLVALSHFILAMVKYPAVMKKAQAEIDSVTGGRRLPNADDRPALPYLEAVLSECLRWAVPVPLGLPHRLMEDDVYEGKIIPKGTLVFANIWNMSRDPKLFSNPEDFLPDRFLETAQDATHAKRCDPSNFVFGFGRRRCPGTHLADAFLWLAIACMLATLDFGKASDASGNSVEPQPEYNNATFRMPEPFPCKIRPRSELAAQLVREAVATSS